MRVALRLRATVVHFHWLHGFALRGGRVRYFPQIAVLVQVMILRLFGRRIVWTAHNLRNHQGRHLAKEFRFTWVMARLAHRIIVHGQIARHAVIQTYRVDERKVVVIPHGHYIDWYPNHVSGPAARARLGLPEASTVVLFFGYVRANKGVPELVRAFCELKLEEMELVVAGKVNKLLQDELKDAGAGNTNVHLHPGFVGDEDVQLFMNAADVVVFPYHEILTSGAVLLAMSFRKPCIAVRMGCIPEVLDERGAFLYEPDDPQGLARCLRAVNEAGRDRLHEMGTYNRAKAERWDWNSIARATLSVYRNDVENCVDDTAVRVWDSP
jgi:glycosyltransferase involved in cell wall biosynthesis